MEQFVFLANNLRLKNEAAAVCRIEVAQRGGNRIGNDVADVNVSVAANLVFNLAVVFVSVELVLTGECYPYGLVYAMALFRVAGNGYGLFLHIEQFLFNLCPNILIRRYVVCLYRRKARLGLRRQIHLQVLPQSQLCREHGAKVLILGSSQKLYSLARDKQSAVSARERVYGIDVSARKIEDIVRQSAHVLNRICRELCL